MRPTVIGMDIGGTKIAAHLTDGGTEGHHAITCPTPPEAQPTTLKGVQPDTPAHAAVLAAGRAALMEAVIAICQELIAASDTPVQAIGIGTAGLVDTRRGVIIDANDNLVGWRGAAVAETVSAACGVPVVVENDVRAMALAELTHGAARGLESALCITVGTGIGGAIIQDGRVWHGAHFSAGEIGYLSGAPGQSIEECYSGAGLEYQFARLQKLDTPIPLREIVARAKAGDSRCRRFIEYMTYKFGSILASVIMLLDPHAVIIGGGVPDIGALWWTPFIDGVREKSLHSARHVPILPAALGSRAGMIGAGVLAAQSLDNTGQSDP